MEIIAHQIKMAEKGKNCANVRILCPRSIIGNHYRGNDRRHKYAYEVI